MADETTTTPRSTLNFLFGAIDILSAIVIYAAVFQGLPTRYWPIDSGAAILCILFVGAGLGLVLKASWASRAARVVSCVSLVLGLGLVSTLALTASYLAGIYGAIGRGGALILGLAAALMFPYLIALPLAQLAWLGRARRPPLLKEIARSGESTRAAVAGS